VTAEALYGAPLPELAAVCLHAPQLSPLAPGATAIETLGDGALQRLVILAPPGTLERRYVMAHGLRALAHGGDLTVLAPKTRGGSRLAAELTAFGCDVHETARRHHRICRLRRPPNPAGVEAAITAGAARFDPSLELWTQPGVFSWDRIDPGTTLLLASAGGLAGQGADLGCGLGILSAAVLRDAGATALWCVDIDRRAVEAARRNVTDSLARFLHHDLRLGHPSLAKLDFVIMNPPFHDGGQEDRTLGLAFISAAANMLRPGGVCRLVANIALPYEGRLKAEFTSVVGLAQGGGYKVYEAVK
jgi:16S rRNA (guanine1207-N2)-methyltransferase